jgi:DNA-binding MarR family transcriptional regulator
MPYLRKTLPAKPSRLPERQGLGKKTICVSKRRIKMTNEGQITGEALLGLFRRFLKAMSRYHHTHGSTQHAQGHVLAILKERENMGQRHLMEMLNVRSASLSEILAKLERNGLIARERSDQDKRNFIISVTEEGRAMAEEHKAERHKNAETIFASLSDAERGHLAELLGKILISLEKDHPDHAAENEHGFGYRGRPGHHRANEEGGQHGHEGCGQEHHGHDGHSHGRRGASRQEHGRPGEHDPHGEYDK